MVAPTYAEAPPRPIGRRRKSSLPARIWRSRYLYLCLAPTFILLVALEYWPVAMALLRSLYEWNGYNIARFTGAGNFVRLAQDPVFRKAVVNVLALVAFSLVFTNVVSILAAELLFNLRRQRMQHLLRLLFVVPMVVPGIVLLLIWARFFDPVNGLLNAILRLLGLKPLAWLGSFQLALPSLMLVGFPWVDGFALLIFTAGLQSISQEVLDSAAIDGAAGFGRVRYIDLPLILSQIRLIVILLVIDGIQQFTSVLVLTRGGPGNATAVPGYYMYVQAFINTKMGYASAVGVVMCAAILILTYLNLRYIRPATEFEGRQA